MEVRGFNTLVDPNGAETPLIIVEHDLYVSRMHYYRTTHGLVRAGFDEEVVAWAKEALLTSGIIAVGRAEKGEDMDDTMEAIQEYEEKVNRGIQLGRRGW